MVGALSTAVEIGLPALVGFLYLRRCQALAGSGRAPSSARQLCFAAGIAVWVAATLTPLAKLAEELVSAHMVQHLLLTDLAAVLMVLGINGAILAPVLRVLRGARWILLPLPVVALWIAGFYIWHVPILYEGALESPALHGAEHGTFLATGVGKWLLLLGPAAVAAVGMAARLGLAVLSHLSVAALGNAFMWAGTPFYSAYESTAADRGIDPIADQSIAGAIMTVEGMLLTIGLGAWLLLSWAKEDTARQGLIDLAERRGVPLSEERARRAARAGHAGQLRERIEREAGNAATR
ncbi:MAG TPA: cytochrome c oxidase assembly protein [Solirubrobacterales bacterium]|nr:cytochrome c oxidase assembly protein [Solirubrobacterales bacterium]